MERLQLVLQYMPDEELMPILEEERDWGCNEYPVRAVWNSVLAGVVYEHVSVESLRRELKRNAQLRELCRFKLEEDLRMFTPLAHGRATAWKVSIRSVRRWSG